jgi:Tfp pilus assembly protein PilV
MNIKKTTISAVLLGIAMTGLSGCGRKDEYKAQAKLGQPIVSALEDYYTQTGSYPTSLDALPQKYSGWTYETYTYKNSTNGAEISYMLRYRFGKGGVEYEPNRWIGGDKGHYVLLDVR